MERALDSSEKILGPEHFKTATSLSNLADLYRVMGSYAQAEPLYKRALAICEKVHGPEHPNTAISLNNLAVLYLQMGSYAQAEPLWKRVLAIDEKVLGPEHPGIACDLANLASLYLQMGSYAQAEPLYKRALAIREKVLIPEHPDTAQSLNSLAALYGRMRSYTAAEPLYQRALAIYEIVLGPEHPSTATTLNNLAILYGNMGSYAKAEPLYKRALAIYEIVLGPEHPYTATSLSSLALLYGSMGSYAQAEPLYERALAINEKVLGPEHPDTASTIANLGFNQILQHKFFEAKPLVQRADTAYHTIWKQLLSFTSEKERQSAISTVGGLDLPGTLGDGLTAADSLLWRKGAILESLTEEKRAVTAANSDPALGATFKKIEALKAELRLALMEGNKAQLSQAQIELKETELESLQKEMARKVSGYGSSRSSLDLKLAQVQAAIPRGSVVVDFMRYIHNLGKKDWEDRYAAVLVAPDIEPVFVPLGKAEPIDAAIGQQREIIERRIGGNLDEQTKVAPELEAVLKELHTLVAAPIEKVLPQGTKELILCPDGQLYFLSFATLLAPSGEFWTEKFALRNISTMRDLMRLAKSTDGQGKGNRRALLVGNPDYNSSIPQRLLAEIEDAREQTDSGAMARAEEERRRQQFALNTLANTRAGDGLSFSPLSGTAVEVAAMKPLFKANNWNEPVTLMGADATEQNVIKAIRGQEIVHIGTHGYFLPDLELGTKSTENMRRAQRGLGDEKKTVRIDDPMLRSGLALVGASTTGRLWEQGKVPPVAGDGLLTAAEVAGLDLQGTRLVTMSACDTAKGDLLSGEGVVGLQRAFAIAGAENLLMTLWPIDDDKTVEVMLTLYKRVIAGEHPAHVLPEVQRDYLKKWRKENNLWFAVNRAAPFVVVTMTNIPPLNK